MSISFEEALNATNNEKNALRVLTITMVVLCAPRNISERRVAKFRACRSCKASDLTLRFLLRHTVQRFVGRSWFIGMSRDTCKSTSKRRSLTTRATLATQLLSPSRICRCGAIRVRRTLIQLRILSFVFACLSFLFAFFPKEGKDVKDGHNSFSGVRTSPWVGTDGERVAVLVIWLKWNSKWASEDASEWTWRASCCFCHLAQVKFEMSFGRLAQGGHCCLRLSLQCFSISSFM